MCLCKFYSRSTKLRCLSILALICSIFTNKTVRWEHPLSTTTVSRLVTSLCFFLWEGGVKTILGYKPLGMVYTDFIPNVSWEAYTMYRNPSSSFSLSYTSEIGVETLTMLCPFTSKKKAWLEFSCSRRLEDRKLNRRFPWNMANKFKCRSKIQKKNCLGNSRFSNSLLLCHIQESHEYQKACVIRALLKAASSPKQHQRGGTCNYTDLIKPQVRHLRPAVLPKRKDNTARDNVHVRLLLLDANHPF